MREAAVALNVRSLSPPILTPAQRYASVEVDEESLGSRDSTPVTSPTSNSDANLGSGRLGIISPASSTSSSATLSMSPTNLPTESRDKENQPGAKNSWQRSLSHDMKGQGSLSPPHSPQPISPPTNAGAPRPFRAAIGEGHTPTFDHFLVVGADLENRATKPHVYNNIIDEITLNLKQKAGGFFGNFNNRKTEEAKPTKVRVKNEESRGRESKATMRCEYLRDMAPIS